MEDNIYKGTIIGFDEHQSKVIGNLIIRDSLTGNVRYVTCITASTVAGFIYAYGKVEPMIGKELYYSVDQYEVLVGFSPVESAPKELIEEYDKQHMMH